MTPPSPSNFTQIAAGEDHSLALTKDGRVYAWGHNGSGRLGDNTTTQRTTPVAVKMPTDVTVSQIDAGTEFSLALDSNGIAYAWGRNNYGQLGNESTTNSSVPVAVKMPHGVTFTAIAAGFTHALALGSDGRAYAWGYGVQGGLGNGGTSDRTSPTPVSMPLDVTFKQIAGGLANSLAVGDDGMTYAWGFNIRPASLGDGTAVNRLKPVTVSVPTDVTLTRVTAGANFSLALDSEGKAYSWGRGEEGQLGNGIANLTTPTPVSPQAGGVPFSQIAAGRTHSLALDRNGKAYSWGQNGLGKLGNGTTTDRSSPGAVTMPLDVTFTQIAARGNHSLALGSDGRAYSWGANTNGQLGDGTTTFRSTPGLVSVPVTAVTSVTFDGTAGTALTNLGTGSWKVTAPAHARGPVNVVMNWTLGGIAQTPITYTNGFTYIGPKVKITSRAYSDASRTTEIPKGSVLSPGTTIYWKYTVENTGAVPVLIQELKRDSTLLTLPADCAAVELAVAATTTCTAQSTV